VRCISSGLTIFIKWGAPLLMAATVAFAVLSVATAPKPFAAADFVWPAVLVLAFLAFHLLTAARLADAVFDCGDHLFVRKGSRAVRVPLATVRKVSEGLVLARATPQVVVDLEEPNELGHSFTFLAARHGLAGGYARVGMVAHLRLRAERARTKNAA
jgi:hypothetical protein